MTFCVKPRPEHDVASFFICQKYTRYFPSSIEEGAYKQVTEMRYQFSFASQIKLWGKTASIKEHAAELFETGIEHMTLVERRQLHISTPLSKNDHFCRMRFSGLCITLSNSNMLLCMHHMLMHLRHRYRLNV